MRRARANPKPRRRDKIALRRLLSCSRTSAERAPKAGHSLDRDLSAWRTLIRIRRIAINQDYLRAACASVGAFFAAVRSSDFNPACAFASAAVSLAFVAESVVSGIAPFPSF